MRKNNNNFEKSKDREILEKDFCFVAAFGLNDDLREGVPEAIKKLQDGGVNIRMISGDHLHTAIQCAIKAGIIEAGDEDKEKVCMTGADF